MNMIPRVRMGITGTVGSELMKQFANFTQVFYIKVFYIKAFSHLLQKLEIVTEFESTTYADILKVLRA